MSEQLAHSVYVSAEVKHHHGESMPAAVECNLLVNVCSIHPGLQSLVSAVHVGQHVREYEVVGISSWSHQIYSLLVYVEVFKSACLFLLEDKSCEIALLMDLAPCQFQNITSS